MKLTLNGTQLEIDGMRVGISIDHMSPNMRMRLEDVLYELEETTIAHAGLEDEAESLGEVRASAYSRGYNRGWDDRDGDKEWDDEERT